MATFTLLALVVAAFQLTASTPPFVGSKAFIHSLPQDLGEPLILTPYLEQNKIQEAREAAEVHLDDFQNITSYSGFFTVDKPSNSNLFFWFFPSVNQSDPIILWLQGGPGSSSIYGLFVEHGPFEVNSGRVNLRNITWAKKHSLLYIDQPVGSGFSFTKGNLVSDQYQIANHLYSALTQFFTIFKEFQNNEFFAAGESYAGKYVPAIGYKIHKENPTASLKINLQGLLIGNGYCDPINQIKWGEFLYQVGIVDQQTFLYFRQLEEYVISNIKEGNYKNATAYRNQIIGKLYPDVAGVSTTYNILKDVDDSPSEYKQFVVKDDVRRAIHVGNQTYNDESDDVYEALYEDITKSVAPWISELLSHYRMLFYNGQLDMVVAYVLTEEFLQHLNFTAAAEYSNANRTIWKIGDRVAGYVKTAGLMTEVLVRGAGHIVPYEQPESAYDMVYKFIRNIQIAGS